MSGPTAALLHGGTRLHLQHGPIDLVISADGDRDRAFEAAHARFATVLDELVAELPLLRTPLTAQSPRPKGDIARVMFEATKPFADHYVTPMAAVAGSVAQTVLAEMLAQADLRRAIVNNGGDIAFHLAEGAQYRTAMAGHDASDLGRIDIHHRDQTRGMATSGRHGRSLSLGIADSVTVLAKTAAQADVAATIIANAVDLPGHPGVRRSPARALDEDSDLGGLPVVVGRAPLSTGDIQLALRHGQVAAEGCLRRGLITGAALFLQGQYRMVGVSQVHPALEDS